MPRILITCPETGKPVPTGIALDAASFASAVFDPRGRDAARAALPPYGAAAVMAMTTSLPSRKKQPAIGTM